MPVENVTCHVTRLGGAFGRKAMADFTVEAAYLSRASGRPVKVTWSREDDIKFDYYNAVAAMYMKAALGNGGRPTAWLQRSTFPPITSLFNVDAVYGDPGHLQQGWTDIPFDIPNLRVENGAAKAHVRIGWLRSVANIYHAFAVQTFADELAHLAGRDPLEYLLELIGPPRILNLDGADYPNYGASYQTYPIDTGRLRRVLELAAEKSGWAKRRPANRLWLGTRRASQFRDLRRRRWCRSRSVRRGRLRIPRVDMAVDAGQIVDRQLVRRNSRAPRSSEPVSRAAVKLPRPTALSTSPTSTTIRSRGLTKRRSRRMSISSKASAPPGGVGEPGVPPYVPALCNAIYAATGKRVRELPLSKIDLRKVAH